MLIRHSTLADLPAMEDLYARARAYMADNGNPTQWGDSYPLREWLEEDIAEGRGYVCEEDGQVVATFMFTAGPDSTYAVIENGQWSTVSPPAAPERERERSA